MKQISYITLLIIIITSCQNNLKENNIPQEVKIDSISVLYHNYIFNAARAKKCEEVRLYIPNFLERDSDGVLQETILDTLILKRIDVKVRKLVNSKINSYPDARMQAKIFYNNGNVDSLCISDFFSSFIFKDGVLQEQDNELLFLIKNNAGYYSWFGEPVLEYMNELKDTSFVREPFKISKYLK